MGAIEIVTTARRPDLIAVIAPWLWREWAQAKGRSLARVTDRLDAIRDAE